MDLNIAGCGSSLAGYYLPGRGIVIQGPTLPLQPSEPQDVSADLPATLSEVTSTPYIAKCDSCQCGITRFERDLLPLECPACGQRLGWSDPVCAV